MPQTCMHAEATDGTLSAAVPLKAPQRNETKKGKEGRGGGKKGAAAAKGDYKEKYSPHSLPTHALQGGLSCL